MLLICTTTQKYLTVNLADCYFSTKNSINKVNYFLKIKMDVKRATLSSTAPHICIFYIKYFHVLIFDHISYKLTRRPLVEAISLLRPTIS